MQSISDKSQSQTVKALLALRELVVSGELVPGERVPELAMVERIGVSRTPLRAALIRLEGEGLLEALPAGGYAARRLSIQDVFAATEIRGALEGLAARFAAERRLGEPELAAILETQDQIDALVASGRSGSETFSEYVPLNERFHEQLAELSASPVIQQQIDRANAYPFAAASGLIDIQIHLPDARKILLIAQDHHRCVLEAIKAGESGRAETLMREHARLAHRYLRQALEDQEAVAQMPGASMLRRTG
ncbi:MAG: GntR family transcriptional regulator [Pseudomonadota bacterium]